MDCNLCNGTGEAPKSPYREASPMKKKETLKGPSWYRRTMVRVPWKKVGIGALVFGGLVGFFVGIIAIKRDQARHPIRRATITAQYDDKGQVVRCWVGEHDDWSASNRPGLSDHNGSQECGNIDDSVCMKHAGFTLGINDVNTCTWMEKTR